MVAIAKEYKPEELVALSSLTRKAMSDNVALNSIARSLENIARELGRLNQGINLITSLEAEIVLDIHSRRAAERSAWTAYHAELEQAVPA
jgi:hypothetical protein